MTNPYRTILFSRETVFGVIGAMVCISGMVGFWSAPLWAGTVYAAIIRL